MPSKTSKRARRRAPAKSAARVCSEAQLAEFAQEWHARIPPGAVVFLEGELGAGKSTLAREFVRAFCGEATEFSGSPTYPLCIEYRARDGARLAHMDFYRVKSSSELEERGLLEVIWDPKTRSLVEWGSLFPEVAELLAAKGRKTLHVQLESVPEDSTLRRVSARWA